MKVAGWRPGRLTTAVLLGVLGAMLSACGGGEDPNAGTTATPLAAAPSAGATESQAPRRKALAYDRKGVSALVVSPDGKTVALANSDGRVRLLDSSGAAAATKLLKPAGSGVTAGLIFTGDARYLVTVGRDSLAQVWKVDTGEVRFSLRGHEHALRSITASGDGSLIATGGEETRVMLWDGTTGRLKRIFTGPTDFVNTVSLSADGRWLASGDAAARVLVWNVATGQLLHTLRGHANEVNAVAFSPDGRLIASTGEDGKALLWDATSGTQVAALENSGGAMRSLAFSSDGALIAGGAADGRVLVWDTATHKVSEQLAGPGGAVNALAFDVRNPKQLFVGDAGSDGDTAKGVMAMRMSGAATR